MKTILQTVDIASSPRAIFGALSTEAGLRGWWTTMVRSDDQQGGTIDFTFGGDFNPTMEIVTIDPSSMVVAWTCVGGHDPWHGSAFTFEIAQRDSGCAVFFAQEYARELNDEEYGRYNFNWGYYLESLRRLVESGRGTPHRGAEPDDPKAVVVRFVEEYKNKHNPQIVDELVSEDCAVNIPVPGLPQGREGMRVNHGLVCGAFPDVHVTREFLIAEDDLVVERATAKATHRGELLGKAATGQPVTWTELHAYRVVDGKICAVWSELNLLGVMVQIGAFAPPHKRET